MSTKSVVTMWVVLLLVFTGHAQEARRVVSLAPSVTEIIYSVGGKGQLVGCTSYCKQAVNDGVEQVGSTVDINVEKLFSLQPDLVLAMELTKPQDIAALKKLGIHVEQFSSPQNFNEICEQTLQIAALIGKSGQAQKLLDETKRKVTAIRQKASTLEHKKVFFQIGANPIFSVLRNTFMNDFITICNGENIAADLSRGTMTRESVLLRNPDVIIIATMGGFGEEEQKVWNGYGQISAVAGQKVFLIDSETSCSPTPLAFVSALEDVFRFMSE
ncbi:MAG: ABC transporter substrate-binding protein [Draconibacterium sp.]